MPVSKEALDELAISEAEYEAIVDRLGREPNHLELGLFGSLWSFFGNRHFIYTKS